MKQKGFGIVEVILFVVIIGLIGFVVWRVWDARSLYESTGENNTSYPQQDTVPPVNNKEDLEKIEKQLDDTQLDGGYDAELENESTF